MIEKVINTIYITGGVGLLMFLLTCMTSCTTTQLTQKQIEINYKLDKLHIDYKYKSDSLINEFYKK
tara:strand:+ start:2059 stop:2256 length:198 start_codon:yes stop_codon:yes gene_type:complete